MSESSKSDDPESGDKAGESAAASETGKSAASAVASVAKSREAEANLQQKDESKDGEDESKEASKRSIKAPVGKASKGAGGKETSMSMESGGGKEAGSPLSGRTQGSETDAEAGGRGRVSSVSARTSRTQEPDEDSAGKRTVMGRLRRLFANEPEAMPFIGAYMRDKPGKTPEEEEGQGRQKKLGLMIGVYLPSIQNVFGVIMFLRLCWMVGMMGVWQAFLMVFLCCLTTFLTTLSVSAIATNGVVQSGGTYFMISRSLGPHLGVACGILFYLANTIAVAMYIVGAIEIFLNYMVPWAYLWGGTDYAAIRSEMKMFTSTYNMHVRIYGTILLLFLFFVVSLGVRIVQLFAPVSLAGVIIGIVAIYAGAVQKSISVDDRPKMCVSMPDRYLLSSGHCKYPDNATNKPVYFDIYCCRACEWCPANHPSQCPARNQSMDWYMKTTYADRAAMGCTTTKCIDGIPGLSSEIFASNSYSKYTTETNSVYRMRNSIGGEAVAESELEAGKQEAADKSNEGHDGVVMNHQVTTFFVIMGIYFPSVTGILTGTNMSGDLADPQKSIPSGTLAAQLTTSFVYLSFVLIFGACVEPGVLLDKNGDSIENRMIIGELAWPSHWVVVSGCFLSTFGAGLQSLCSAPRLLASIAKDNVLPVLAPFAKVNCWNEPFIALVFTTAIAFVCLMIAILDYVAPLVAMFFLQLYAYVNLACAVMTLIGSPGWRPRYKGYHWTLSLAGFFLSYFIMFSTFWYFAVLTVVVGVAIAVLVAWKGRDMEWGDGTQGLSLSLAQFFLYKLEGKKSHPKNWRPQILIINQASAKTDFTQSFAFIQQLKASKGFLMISNLIEVTKGADTPVNAGEEGKESTPEKQAQQIREEMEKADITGFVENVFYRTGRLGPTVSVLIQTAGVSGLKPNTIFAPWPSKMNKDEDEFWTFLDRIHRASRLNHCLIIVKGLGVWPGLRDRKTGNMDVWWIIKDGGLLLLVAHLLKKHHVWARTKLRIFLVQEEEDKAGKAEGEKKEGETEPGADAVVRESVEKLLYQLRIQAEVRVVRMKADETSAYTRVAPAEGKREEILSDMDAKEAAKVRARDPQMVAEAAAKQQRDLFSGRESNSFLEAHPLTKFTFKKFADDASYVEKPAGRRKSVDDQISGFNRDTCKTARVLNHRIREFSAEADVLILNLPQPPNSTDAMQNYMLYMEILMNKLDRVVLVRGTGKEVITIYQ